MPTRTDSPARGPADRAPMDFACRLAGAVWCGAALAVSRSGGAQRTPRVDPAVSAVVAIGGWEGGGGSGSVRLVVTTFGSEHSASRLYVQWLEQPGDVDTRRLVRTLRVDAPIEHGGWVEVLQVIGGTCAVLEVADDHEDPAVVTRWLLRAGAPGRVKLRRVAPRGTAPPGGAAESGAERHYPTHEEVDAGRRTAAAGCATFGRGAR